MFSVSIQWSVPETDSWEFECSCPICRLETTVTFGQVRHEDYIICRGCYRTLKLIDQLGDMQHLQKSLKDMFS